MSRLRDLRVLQEDMGSDAVTFENAAEGFTYLFISPNQSFESAVTSVMKACPDLSLTEVQEIIRRHCPDIREMNELMGATGQPVPRFDTRDIVPPPADDKGAHRRPRPPRWARIGAVAAPALIGGALIAHFFNPAGNNTQGSSGTGVTVSQADGASVFDDPVYQQYVADGSLRCQTIGQYAAKCVDSDGQVMLSEASVGDSVVFTFSYESEKIGFRVFEDAAEAKMWLSEDGNQRLYDNMRAVGRVVLWGTDAKRLRDWGNALSTQSASKTSAMGHVAPQSTFSALPPRLAALAFGTLGVSDTSNPKAPVGSIHAAQTLRAVELVMGVAEDDGDGGYRNVPAGPNDAVAIAANAPRPPVWGAGNGVGPSGAASPNPVNKPASTAPAETPAAPTTPAATPPVTTAPPASAPPASPTPTEPAAAPPITVKSEPAPDTPPADSTTPPTTTSDPAPAPSEPVASEPAPVQPQDTTPAQTLPEEPAAPAAVDPAPVEEPAAEETPLPAAEPVEAAPDTTPAPPVEEEPEDDGVSMDALPSAWAA